MLCFLLIWISSNSFGIVNSATLMEPNEEPIGTETRDSKLEIVKKIKKINNDGSYTIGYEADDGSFKIESRDVLGHIKGTYGFVDENGQIKRVSYTTSNSSEIVTTQESPTVVQRIPSRNHTNTNRMTYFSKNFSSTQVPRSTSLISPYENIIKRNFFSNSANSSTSKPNTSTINYDAPTSTKSHHSTYTPSPSRILLQERLPPASQISEELKSEGQLVRPEILTVKPTNSNDFSLKRLEVVKPVHEEDSVSERSNILRRELPTQNSFRNFDVRNQLQQSLGHDSSDIYTNSMSTINPKPPLFTTTSRPGPVAISTTPFPYSTARTQLSYSQETTTPTASAIVQIPANSHDNAGQFVAFSQPSSKNSILIPVNQIHGKLIPSDPIHTNYNHQQYELDEKMDNTRVIEIEQQKAIVRRLPTTFSKEISPEPERNAYAGDAHQQIQIPYPLLFPGQLQTTDHETASAIIFEPTTKNVQPQIGNDVDNIEPPVSTRDFQKLLQQLIFRQSRLEKVSMLTKQSDLVAYEPSATKVTYTQHVPFFYKMSTSHHPVNAVSFERLEPRVEMPEPLQRNYNTINNPKRQSSSSFQNIFFDQNDSQAYRPNRRFARLQPSARSGQHGPVFEQKNEYLPSDVREMLLLRMLQLAINPALPIDENEIEILRPSTRRKPVRNVEILGEED